MLVKGGGIRVAGLGWLGQGWPGQGGTVLPTLGTPPHPAGRTRPAHRTQQQGRGTKRVRGARKMVEIRDDTTFAGAV